MKVALGSIVALFGTYTLNRKRSMVLDEIHFKEAQLNRLDYLRYKIQTAQKEREAKQ